jgi:glyoxylase I family protein
VLGFEEVFRENAPGRRACVLRFPGGGYSVGLVAFDPGDGTAFDPYRLGLDHLAFTVASFDELREWERRLTDQGVTHSGVAEVGPGAILNLKDPDGIALALFWDR